MKSKREGLITGECFICKKECRPGAYCHYECAISYSEEQSRRQKEAQVIADGLKKHNQLNQGGIQNE